MMKDLSKMSKREIEDAYWGAQSFFYGVNIVSWITIVSYNTPLRKEINAGDPSSLILMIILTILAIYYYNKTNATDPGFVSRDDYDQESSNQIEFENEEKYQKLNEDKINQQVEINDIETNQIDNFEDLEKNQQQTIQIDLKQNLPEKRFCQICNKLQFYRMKHCNKCEKCVPKFDHHCFWVGTCVGELNHGKFYLFLLFQTLQELFGYYQVYNGMDYYPYSSMKDGETVYSDAYAALFLLAFSLVLLIMFTGILLVYHTYLIICNVSTWEQQRRPAISYLKIYPFGYNPFSKGILQNLNYVFFHNNQIQNWELPPIQDKQSQNKEEAGFNWLENEYYSCC